jgi:hypothetical protein
MMHAGVNVLLQLSRNNTLLFSKCFSNAMNVWKAKEEANRFELGTKRSMNACLGESNVARILHLDVELQTLCLICYI